MIQNNLTIFLVVLASAVILCVALTLYFKGCNDDIAQKNDISVDGC
jgi:hypothetical protein